MFTQNHWIWVILCAAVITLALVWLLRRRPPLRSLLTLCCVAAVLSECIKVFSVIELVPSTDGTELFPYMELQHLPFHLCSFQIIFIFIARFAKDSPARDVLLGFMYPSCTVGAFFALAIPSIFGGTVPVKEAFTHPWPTSIFSTIPCSSSWDCTFCSRARSICVPAIT